MIEQLSQNWVCHAILLLALFCYQQLSQQFLKVKSMAGVPNNHKVLANEQHFSSVLVAALPLLGLLGTIIGLLDCFAAISHQGADPQIMSSGIGDALFTTQLGLVCAIPAWIFQSSVHARAKRFDLLMGIK